VAAQRSCGTTTIIGFTRPTRGRSAQTAIEVRMVRRREGGDALRLGAARHAGGDLPREGSAQLGEAIEAEVAEAAALAAQPAARSEREGPGLDNWRPGAI
jgi:hypothetical protein